jgi:hypothetical protein
MKFVMMFGIVGFLSTSCAMSGGPYVPPGFLYSSVKGPVTATTNMGSGKTGEACASNILGWVATGDNSIDAAKSNGGIRKVASVDYKTFSVLGLYTEVCTVVRGAGAKVAKEAGEAKE